MRVKKKHLFHMCLLFLGLFVYPPNALLSRRHQKAKLKKTNGFFPKKLVRKKTNGFFPKNIFFHPQKGACGNVPTLKRRFFGKKTRLRQRSNTKKTFFHKKRCLRQRSRTKNTFFDLKKLIVKKTKTKTNARAPKVNS